MGVNLILYSQSTVKVATLFPQWLLALFLRWSRLVSWAVRIDQCAEASLDRQRDIVRKVEARELANGPYASLSGKEDIYSRDRFPGRLA